MEFNENYHIRFSLLQGSRIFVFGRFLSNGLWWYPGQLDKSVNSGRGWLRIGRLGITWHGLYGK